MCSCFLFYFFLQFPPSFAAGDVGSSALDLKLSNSVFNTLKQHSYREERQSARLHEKKEHSTHVRNNLLNLRSVVSIQDKHAIQNTGADLAGFSRTP